MQPDNREREREQKTSKDERKVSPFSTQQKMKHQRKKQSGRNEFERGVCKERKGGDNRKCRTQQNESG
jgi:hypothetical protein